MINCNTMWLNRLSFKVRNKIGVLRLGLFLTLESG